MTETGPDRLRAERARLVADDRLGGRGFGEALAAVLDDALAKLGVSVAARGRWALVAMGSYARRELAPGSDVDVMLLCDTRDSGALDEAARGAWYPLWDAGFVLGHAVRSPKDALRLADHDLHAMTSLLDVRFVVGDRAIAEELTERARRLARRRRQALVDDLAGAAESRRRSPGPVAEMLEPELKQGSGGLRDLQALAWTGWALDESGDLEALVALGYLDPEDRRRLDVARERLLDIRLALHRSTGSRSDRLTLQEQDAVASRLGVGDADALVRTLSEHGRDVAWIALDVWRRLGSAATGPARRGSRSREISPGVVLRDDRIAFSRGDVVDALAVLRASIAAAQQEVPFERAALERCASITSVRWGSAEREAFIELLATGARAIPVLEALDHVGALTKLLPEWDHVRSRPQRNAYHRFTVDRHLLEAVARTAELRDDPAFDGDVARRCRGDVLLLGALLHDIAKGIPEDHSTAGSRIAREVGTRLGLDPSGIEVLAWLVRHHLLLADTATRRDLADETTILRFGRTVGDSERLDLLYALTIGDSMATGPAAWNSSRAALVRELYLRTDAVLEAGVVADSVAEERRTELAELVGDAAAVGLLDAFPPGYSATFSAPEMARHLELVTEGRFAVDWRDTPDDILEVTVVAPDRPGLLARVAGALAVLGLDIQGANALSHRDGLALEVFACRDRFGRFDDVGERRRAEELVAAAVEGSADLGELLRQRRRRYRAEPGDVVVRFDLDASTSATVLEVEAPDEVGLLATVASVFADLAVDVTLAKVQTLGDRVIDVFYVRDASGAKIVDRLTLERLHATLVARLTTEYALPDPSP